jgi:WD40 repeat protein
LSTGTNPYPGLPAFQEKDAGRFFGRDAEVDDVIARLVTHRLLAVIGVSGCGKSSLIRAGVLPVLRLGASEQLPVLWKICITMPGYSPLGNLRAALNAPAKWPQNSFDLVDYGRSHLKNGEALLLIIDQFEELFGFYKSSLPVDAGNSASLFVNLILKASEQREVPIYVVITMRTDFLGQCSQFRGLPEALNDSYYLVPRLTRLQQQEAIELPLREQHQEIHPALLQRLLNDSAEEPDHLPILQHLLKRMWDHWSNDPSRRFIDINDYNAVGGWTNALNNDGNEVLTAFSEDHEEIKRLFQWITEPGSGERPVRRPRPYDECRGISGFQSERFSKLVSNFQARGFLRVTADSRLDVQHETVMWQWSELAKWIAEEAESSTQLRFLHQAAQNHVPLIGLTLQTARKWRSQLQEHRESVGRYLKPAELEETEKWVAESERREGASRRLRFWGLGIVGALVLALLAVWITVRQRSAAEARELTALAAVNAQEYPERALILGLFAWRKNHDFVPGLEEALHGAILESGAGRTLLGHKGAVFSVSWSPDGKRVATAGGDHLAIVWDTEGNELFRLTGHLDSVRAVAWSPDGTKLLTASWDGTARVWEGSTGKNLIEWSPGTVESGECPHYNPNDRARFRLAAAAWSPDGRFVAVGGWQGVVTIWELESQQSVRRSMLLRCAEAETRITSISWSPDGKRLATGSQITTGGRKSGTAVIWDIRNGKSLRNLQFPNPVSSVVWSPDVEKLAVSGGEMAVTIWSLSTGSMLLELCGHEGFVNSVAWFKDDKGGKLLTAGEDATARVWSSDSGKELLVLKSDQGQILNVDWSPDGRTVITAGRDGSAKLWPASQKHEFLTLQGHSGRVWSVAWAPNKSQLASAGDDGTLRIWDATTGSLVRELQSQGQPVVSVAWSSDGARVASAGDDQKITIWNYDNGQKVGPWLAHGNSIGAVSWSPDGKTLASASDDRTAKLWNSENGQELGTLEGHEDRVVDLAWSPDGRKIATAGWDQVGIIWDVATRKPILTLKGHLNSLLCISWSPDGKHVVTGSADKTAIVWNANNGESLMKLRGHVGSVLGASWSPDSKRVATSSDDGTARIWDTASGRESLTLYGINRVPVRSIAWSPDGKYFVAFTDDGLGQIYVLDHAEFLRLVKQRITRRPPLTDEECSRFLGEKSCPSLPEVP